MIEMEAAAAVPAAGTKVVTFLRHGVAAHNFHDAQDPHPDEPTRYTDSPLTDYGRAQAAATGTASAALGCEMLVVAPLSRAIETGLLAFPYVTKVVAHEQVREYAARRYANKRLTRTELEEIFRDSVDFAMIASDPDPLFNPDEAEPWPAGPIQRAREFMDWLIQQPEQRIVVASHGVFIEVLLKLLNALPKVCLRPARLGTYCEF